MAEQFVGKLSEFKDGDRRIIFVGDNEIGVFRHEGQFYAYSNFCLHQGGPACEGLTIAKVEERLMPDKTSRGLYFSETEMHFVRPWHGYGFLPGYHQPPNNAIPVYGAKGAVTGESDYSPSYYGYNGERYYFGRPGFYRGRYNGGSFGPCWSWTPIGPAWNCG